MRILHSKNMAAMKLTLTVAVLLLMLGASNAQADQLSHGHDMLLIRGLQLNALVFTERNDGYWSATNWTDSYFTTVHTHSGNNFTMSYYGQPGEFSWSRQEVGDDTELEAWELPYLADMVTWQYHDEQQLGDPCERDAITNWMSQVRAQDGYEHLILHANQGAKKVSQVDMRLYMQQAEPDMLTFDWYGFNGRTDPGTFNNPGGSPTFLYSCMAHTRQLALEGNDGGGTTPIPYGLYVQTWTPGPREPSDPPMQPSEGYRLSESEIRLNHYAAWAFGYTWSCAFIYDDLGNAYVRPLLFDGGGADPCRMPEFDYVAETNRQGRNLGRSLVGLQNVRIRIKQGPNSDSGHDIAAFDNTAVAYLDDMTVANLGSKNGSQPGDVLVGTFEVLDEDFDGPAYSDEVYFMVVNGLSDPCGTASETQQQITLNFDFGGIATINSLQRVDRDSGAIEPVALVPDGGNTYHLDLTLDGGTGDLFKYNTGASHVADRDWTCAEVIAQGYGVEADYNADCRVDLADYAAWTGSWMNCFDPNDYDCSEPWQ